MIHTLQTLHNDIVGLLYDIKELVTLYHGNLIVLCVAVAEGFFNHNRPNAGMFFNIFKKRFTVKSKSETNTEFNHSTSEETTKEYVDKNLTFEDFTVGVSPIHSTSQGIFLFFAYRCYEVYKRSTISLGVVTSLLLMCCMLSCYCCIKKRGEVYLLRNLRGIDNHHSHLRNSDENIPESAAEKRTT